MRKQVTLFKNGFIRFRENAVEKIAAIQKVVFTKTLDGIR